MQGQREEPEMQGQREEPEGSENIGSRCLNKFVQDECRTLASSRKNLVVGNNTEREVSPLMNFETPSTQQHRKRV
jgi:hypothetical protein